MLEDVHFADELLLGFTIDSGAREQVCRAGLSCRGGPPRTGDAVDLICRAEDSKDPTMQTSEHTVTSVIRT